MGVLRRMTSCCNCGEFPAKNEFYYLNTRMHLCIDCFNLEIKKEKLCVKAGYSEGENISRIQSQGENHGR